VGVVTRDMIRYNATTENWSS